MSTRRAGPAEWGAGAACVLLLAAVAGANAAQVRLASNETAAIATLRNLASCQAQVQTSGKIDVDRDGIGEYGTFLELTGTVGVRRGLNIGKGTPRGEPGYEPPGATFRRRGKPISPAVLSPALANVDTRGFVSKAGYAFMIFLPDTSSPASFAWEAGPADAARIAGAAGRVGIDLAETTWCAYAQPMARGETGNRRFFVNQAGDVMQSANEVARAQGVSVVINGNSAFIGFGITSRVAVGTVGLDGDVWKVSN